jgi:chromosome segregation ATPase
LKKVRDDVDCKRQENFYLLKVIEDLKSKNSEYAQQIDQLTLIADELVDCKGDSMQRIETLEDELTMRQTVIDEITVALEQKSEENVQLNEELTHIKAKNDEFKTEVRTLVNLTKENVQHITTLEGGLMAKKMMIDKLTVSLEQKTTENAFLTDRVEHYKVKHDGLKTVIKDLVISNKENINTIGMLEDKLASKMSTINEMNQNLDALTSTCEEMKIENAKLNEKLAHSQAESDKFKSKVETMVARTQERRSVLEADLADKQDTIDKMSAEILETQAVCEERAAENIELIEKLQHHQITIDQYKTSNTKLLDVVERITQQFNDEKARHETEMDELVKKLGSSYEKEIESMKDVLEAEKEDVVKKAQEDVNLIKIEMSSQISVLNETLEESTVELKKAMLDIQRKNTLLDEKNTEINDLTEQLQLVKAKNALQVQVTNKKKADNVNLEKQLQLAQAKVITLYDQLANNATIECSNNGRHNKSTMTQDHDTNFVSSNASELESMMSSLQQHVVGLQYQPTYE